MFMKNLLAAGKGSESVSSDSLYSKAEEGY